MDKWNDNKISKEEQRKNRADTMNAVNKYLNETSKELKKDISEQGFKLNKEHKLYKKDRERLYAILDKRPIFRSILEVSEYSIVLNVDAHYQVTKCGCNYFKNYLYIWDNQADKQYIQEKELRTDYTAEELQQAEQELDKNKEQQRELKNRQYELERLTINR